MCARTSPSVRLAIRLSVMILATLAQSEGICDGVPSTAHSSIKLSSVYRAVDNALHLKSISIFLIYSQKQVADTH